MNKSPSALLILGCPCIPFESIDNCRELLLRIIKSRSGGYSVAINAEKIMRFRNDPVMRSVIEHSVLPVPDGSGAVLGLRWLHSRRSIKLDLPRLALEVANAGMSRLFVAGSHEDVNSAACDVIASNYRNINICGRLHGYASEDELASEIVRCAPDIVLLGLGSPKQEYVASRLVKVCPGVFIVGCGGALDALTGRVKRAPKFMINNHLEWLYRIMKQPSRWRRQIQLPKYLFALIREVAFRR